VTMRSVGTAFRHKLITGRRRTWKEDNVIVADDCPTRRIDAAAQICSTAHGASISLSVVPSPLSRFTAVNSSSTVGKQTSETDDGSRRASAPPQTPAATLPHAAVAHPAIYSPLAADRGRQTATSICSRFSHDRRSPYVIVLRRRLYVSRRYQPDGQFSIHSGEKNDQISVFPTASLSIKALKVLQ